MSRGNGRPHWSWLLPVAGALWAAWHLRRSYFFYDEWSMVDRVLHSSPVHGTLASFNGHLWMLQYWVYRAQVFGFGVDDHRFVSVVFIGALVTLHLSLAALFRAAGLSKASGAVLGGLLTYLGVASQNFLFAIQISTTLSMAAGVAACAIVLSGGPTTLRAVTASLLLLASVGIDSGTALITVTLATVVALLSWRGLARIAVLLPAVLAVVLWGALGDAGRAHPADLQTRALIARQLLLLAAGGLFGQVGTVGEVTGSVVLAGSIILMGIGIRRNLVDDRGRIMLIAGAMASVVITIALVMARAGIPGFNFVDLNRYLQNVAIPLTLAGAPAIGSMIRAWMARDISTERRRVVAIAGPALAFTAFLLGIPPMQSYAAIFEHYNRSTRAGVTDATVVIRDGCPSGAAPTESSTPLGALSPQISTRLLHELIMQGRLQATSTAQPDPAIVKRMCGDQ